MDEELKLRVGEDIYRQLYKLFGKELDDTFCNYVGHRKCTVKNTCLRYALEKHHLLSEYYYTRGNTDDENCPNYLPVYIKINKE